jgi:hypothetical protein
MKKLFACLFLIGTMGLASAQVSNFTGFSGAVNLSAAATKTKIDTDYDGLGGENWTGSFQGAYGVEMSNSSVLGMGLTYAAGKSKSGSLVGDDGYTYTAALKNQYSLYLEPGTLLSDNTLLYGKISYEKAKLALDSSDGSVVASKSVKGTGYGVGLRHMLDKTKFVQVEFKKVSYNSTLAADETTTLKSTATLGTIGIGMKF